MTDLYTQSIYHDPAAGTPATRDERQGDSAALDEQVEATPTADHIVVRKNEDGTETHIVNGVEHHIGNPAKQAEQSEKEALNSKQLLSELLARTGSVIHKHKVEGRDWFLLEMDQF